MPLGRRIWPIWPIDLLSELAIAKESKWDGWLPRFRLNVKCLFGLEKLGRWYRVNSVLLYVSWYRYHYYLSEARTSSKQYFKIQRFCIGISSQITCLVTAYVNVHICVWRVVFWGVTPYSLVDIDRFLDDRTDSNFRVKELAKQGTSREERNAYKILVGNPVRMKAPWRARSRWKILKWMIKETGWECVYWIHLAQDRGHYCDAGDVINVGFRKHWNFLQWVNGKLFGCQWGLCCMKLVNLLFYIVYWGKVRLSPLVTSASNWPIVSAPDDR
jgi:hypothetical protein